jgi:NTP pyrophosphatase (non-canonical NTP hydrolase)
VPFPLEEEMSELRDRAGSTQELVRKTMLRAGGYWRPLAAVARLLEELGELVELLAGQGASEREVAHELADLWIITTALADQFLGEIAEPRTKASNGMEVSRAVNGAIVAAGEIARVVNYYDGPKAPRSTSELPSLREAVPRFHEALSALAGTLGVDLAKAVGEKIEVIHGRDMERFEREDSDPSTAASLTLLRESPTLTSDPVLDLRLWGAPAWRGGSVSEAATAMLPSLVSFAKAADAEGLEGYLIAGPATKGMERPYWLDALLDTLRPGLGGVKPGTRVLASAPDDPWTFVVLSRDGG